MSSTPILQPNDTRARAFFQGLAGDANATTLSPEALRRSVDGLAGGPVNGQIDPVEREAILTIARQADLPEANIRQITDALDRGVSIDIPRATPSDAPSRFPAWFDMSSLSTASTPCGCDASAGTLVDRSGNQMEVIRAADGLEARFARAGQDLAGQPTIKLNDTERAAIAPRIMETILRQSQAGAVNEHARDWQRIFSAHNPPSQAPADERDLTSLRDGGGSRTIDGKAVEVVTGPDDQTAWIRHDRNNPGQVEVAYTDDPWTDPQGFRPMSQREMETFLASRQLEPVYGDFWRRNFTASQGFVSATRE